MTAASVQLARSCSATAAACTTSHRLWSPNSGTGRCGFNVGGSGFTAGESADTSSDDQSGSSAAMVRPLWDIRRSKVRSRCPLYVRTLYASTRQSKTQLHLGDFETC